VTVTADAIRPPRTIVAAFVATIAAAVLSVVSAVLWWGYQNYLRNEFVKANHKLKAGDKNKKPENTYTVTSHAVNHDVHNWLTSGVLQAVIFGLAFVLVAVSMRRGKSWARWLLLILFALPVTLLPTGILYRFLAVATNAPALTKVASALTGLAGLAVIVLLLVPESARYFAAVRAEQRGEGAESAAPTGLRGLFMPRVPPEAGASRTKTAPKTGTPSKPALPEKPVATRPAKAATPPTVARQAKAKVRTSAEAEASSTPPRAASSVAAKSRSKSRKGS
jgi:hypothetical protein